MEEAQVVLRTKLIDAHGVFAEYGIPVTTQRDLRRRGEFVSALKIGASLVLPARGDGGMARRQSREW